MTNIIFGTICAACGFVAGVFFGVMLAALIVAAKRYDDDDG